MSIEDREKKKGEVANIIVCDESENQDTSFIKCEV